MSCEFLQRNGECKFLTRKHGDPIKCDQSTPSESCEHIWGDQKPKLRFETTEFDGLSDTAKDILPGLSGGKVKPPEEE